MTVLPHGRTPDTLHALAVAGGVGTVLAQDGSVLVTPRPVDRLVTEVARLEQEHRPRWVWWQTREDAGPLVARGVRLARCWDLAEVHRVLCGGHRADPATVWAVAHDLDPRTVPVPGPPDLFAFAHTQGEAGDPEPDPGALVTRDGHLRPDAADRTWQRTPERLVTWARAALDVAARQRAHVDAAASPTAAGGTRRAPERLLVTATCESAAALLCAELEVTGLPVDRVVVEELITAAAGPRPTDEAQAAGLRARRDQEVLRHVPGRERTDLRNPLQVKELLAAVGVIVDDTRKWTLAAHRSSHPVVEALLAWRKAERIATTYGWHWLDTYVGPDDRLRGEWTACDGGAGRMTAANGLHNLPAELRPAVAAHPGRVLVRADLGQIEPRVLAAVARDAAFAQATQADDLYSPVGAELGVERPVAKIAVLAAMYGQTSGSAGEALKRLDEAYPTAMAYLARAHQAGVRGDPVITWGGRLVPMWQGELSEAQRAGRGRFARNAVIQGAAAELFKAWAATVRAGGRALDAEIVLCLHDELLVHVPTEHAAAAEALLHRSLDQAARRWAGTDRVRFVADVSVVHRWSEAKD
ncbi:DNA polymerase [Arsenicicoccus dermatophilus]|uniref:DNA polymerase n=1 Tax=Arsenicicoccus dermatophilus TaxID=1076331 RepID=UPI00391764B9